jgi:RNA polymerase sigma-70 factor, ECF subfamily
MAVTGAPGDFKSRRRDKTTPKRHVTPSWAFANRLRGSVRADRDSEWSSLLRAANAGDSLAYQRFLRELAPVLRAFVRRLLARTNSAGAEAEDIVQDILLAIHLKRQTWIETAPVTPWVFTIARHKTIDALRRRGRRIDVPIDDFAEILAADTEEPNLASVYIDRQLGTLPDVQRKVVQAIAVAGDSISEAAEKLMMTQGAVRVALHRGLASLAARTSKGGGAA